MSSTQASSMHHASVQPQAKCLNHLEDGGKLWVALTGQGFVQVFSGQASQPWLLDLGTNLSGTDLH